MEGFVRRKNGRYQAGYKVRDVKTGKWGQVTKTFDTRREADAWRRQRLNEYDGAVSEARSMTVADLLDEWFDFANEGWSPTTRRNSTYILKVLKENFGPIPLVKFRGRDIDRWIVNQRRAGQAPATIIRRVGVLRLALRQGIKWGYINRDPIVDATLPKQKRTEITPPTAEELAVLLVACDNHTTIGADGEEGLDLGLFVHLAAATGARRGELCALRWSDVDFENETLTIRSAVVDDGNIIVKETKTGSVRTMKIDPHTMTRLRSARRRWRKELLESGEPRENGYIFSPIRTGEIPARPDYFTLAFSRIRRRVGLDHVRLHDLRHFHATLLLSEGVDLATVAQRLGHAGGGRTTIQIYAHATQVNDERSASIVGERLRSLGIDKASSTG
jgi:integrase